MAISSDNGSEAVCMREIWESPPPWFASRVLCKQGNKEFWNNDQLAILCNWIHKYVYDFCKLLLVFLLPPPPLLSWRNLMMFFFPMFFKHGHPLSSLPSFNARVSQDHHKIPWLQYSKIQLLEWKIYPLRWEGCHPRCWGSQSCLLIIYSEAGMVISRTDSISILQSTCWFI